MIFPHRFLGTRFAAYGPYGLRNSSGSFATLAAIRRTSAVLVAVHGVNYFVRAEAPAGAVVAPHIP